MKWYYVMSEANFLEVGFQNRSEGSVLGGSAAPGVTAGCITHPFPGGLQTIPCGYVKNESPPVSSSSTSTSMPTISMSARALAVFETPRLNL